MPRIDPLSLKPEDALAYFKAKRLRVSASWLSLLPDEHAKWFTVAGVARMDILQDIHDAVVKAMDEGQSLQSFRDGLRPLLEAKGWLPSGDNPAWRFDTIYRTNLQTSYSAGRYKQQVENVDTTPLWLFDAIGDERTCEICGPLSGKILPATDKFWDTFYPPTHFNCRCTVAAMSGQQAARLAAEDKDVEVLESSAGMDLPDPAPGWGYNPGKAAWQPDLSKYPPELVRQFFKEESEFDKQGK